MELLLGMYLIYRIELIPTMIRVADEVASPPQVIVIKAEEKKEVLRWEIQK